MRKYPKKCPKCGEYMEPVFDDNIGRSSLGAPLIPNIAQQPMYWKCIYCNYCSRVEKERNKVK